MTDRQAMRRRLLGGRRPCGVDRTEAEGAEAEVEVEMIAVNARLGGMIERVR
jgi:hypothetical protein